MDPSDPFDAAPKDVVLSDWDSRLEVRWCNPGGPPLPEAFCGIGGASPLPLPSILPPPSLRVDIAGGDFVVFSL